MDTSSFDARIGEAVAKRDQLLGEVEEACTGYLSACKDFLQEHFREKTERAVTTQPAVTQALGLEKLGTLKAELNSLIQSIPQIVSDYMDQPDVWNHRKPLPDGLDDQGHLSTAGFSLVHKASEEAQQALREIFGRIGALLIKYGLASSGRDHEWEARPNGLPRYRYGLSTSREMDASIKKYNELFMSFVNAHIQVIEMEKKKEQAIAKDLWNQA